MSTAKQPYRSHRSPWFPRPNVPGDAWTQTQDMAALVELHEAYVAGRREDHPVPELANPAALRQVHRPAGTLGARGALVVDGQDGARADARQGTGDDARVERRSFVSAVCAEPVAESLVAHASKAALLAGMWSPQITVGDEIPVERRASAVARAVGPACERLLEALADRVGDGAGEELSYRGFRILLVDPEWGRSVDHLAEVLREWSTATSRVPPRRSSALSVDDGLIRLQRKALWAVDTWICRCLTRLAEMGGDVAGSVAPRLVVLDADPAHDSDDLREIRYVLPNGTTYMLQPQHDLYASAFAVWAHLRWGLAAAAGRPAPSSLVVDLATWSVLAWWPEYCTEHDDPGPHLGYVSRSRQVWSPGQPKPGAAAAALLFMRQRDVDPPSRPFTCR